MRNAAKKMTNPIDPCTENHFWSFIEISEQNGSLCGFHSGSLWLSFVQKALARLATSQLHSRSLSHSGTDMWISAFKIFSLPIPSRPTTRSFCHYPTRSRPEVKNHYPSVSAPLRPRDFAPLIPQDTNYYLCYICPQQGADALPESGNGRGPVLNTIVCQTLMQLQRIYRAAQIF